MTAALVIVVVSTLLIGREKSRLSAFMCINGRKANLRILLSRIDILPGGTCGTDGKTTTGFVGPAFDQLEYRAALEIHDLFSSRLLESLPKFILRSIQLRGGYAADVAVHIDSSPNHDDADQFLSSRDGGLLLIGSDVYSSLVRRVYESKSSFIRLVSEDSGLPYKTTSPSHGNPAFAVRSQNQPHTFETVPSRSIHREIATIQRVTLPGGARVIMCAGISSSSSYHAVRQLCRDWQSYRSRFGSHDFLVVFAVTGFGSGHNFDLEVTELPEFTRTNSLSGVQDK